ncbi:MAG: diaminopimelate epimerase [Betaproteobacteria bacterium]|nr:diaminopimelate epimerase [Betaproteobacteria bacterium]
MSKLKFTKMQGVGNDFVVLDGIGQQVALTPALVRRIADRHFGVGCDQILLVESPDAPGTDFRYRIWNADGGEVEQCGNGARCFVRYVHDKGLTRKSEIRVQTLSGIITPRLEPDGQVTIDMGAPIFDPVRIPFESTGLMPMDRSPLVTKSGGAWWPLLVDGAEVAVFAVSMGNPHAVQLVENVDTAAVVEQGRVIERHARFPKRVNAGFMQVASRDHIRLRVFERGAGETLACGTGACAAVVAGIRSGLLDAVVRVETRGGELTIRWGGDKNQLNSPVWMTGPAVTVFEGEMEFNER